MTKKRVYIFCGGPSREHEVSISSASSISANISKKKYKVYIFYIRKYFKSVVFPLSNEFKIPEDINLYTQFITLLQEEKDRIDIALLAALHGEFVEDGQIQGIFNYFDIPYTGSRQEACSLAMDKYRSMLLVKRLHGVSIPKTVYVDLNHYKEGTKRFMYPFVIKPNVLGSSVGVGIINSDQDLETHVDYLKKNLNIRYALFQE